MGSEQLNFGWDEREPARADAGPPARAASLAERLSRLAGEGVFIGTSSWKYPGWLGQVYSPERYHVRGRFSERKFNQTCLAEYARTFPTVGGDFSFYQFPTAEAWRELFAQVPASFRFSLKVPEEITVERFPDLPRYGPRAGTANRSFLDAAVLADRLLAPLEPYRDRLGAVIFEFGTFHEGPCRDGRGFTQRLDRFLSQIPVERFSFSVEVRNRDFLDAASGYLDCLRSHGVAHCLNSWTRMPPLAEQLRIPGVLTARHVVARLLLRPGRTYEQAVNQFSPYEKVQDPYPEGRDALGELIARCRQDRRALFALVNNRFEGNAVETIDVVTASLAGQ